MKRIVIGIAALAATACQSGKYNYDAAGMFEATEVIVSAEAAGKIMRLTINEGERVEVGQQLGYIDTMQLHFSKKQMLANLQAIDSRRQDVTKQIAATRQQISTQQKELERAERLVATHAANQKLVDDIQAQLALLQKQLAAQLSTLENNNAGLSGEGDALRAQIAAIDDRLRKSEITGPTAGTVLVKYAEQGEMASVGKPLFKVANLDQMVLRAYITSAQLTELQLGQGVTVYADYGEKAYRTYEGVVSWISDRSEFTPKTIQTRDERANLVYAVKISVPNDGLLKIGMYADIKFK